MNTEVQDEETEYLKSCPEKSKVQCTALMAPEACKNSRRPHGGWLQGPAVFQSETNLLLRLENDCVHVSCVKNVELLSLKLFQCLLR